MRRRERREGWTFHQVGALTAVVTIAIWGSAALCSHMVSPDGLDVTEIVFVAPLVLACWTLVPLYAWRVRWSYIAGILCFLGLFAGAWMAAQGRVLFFSPSLYNLLVILVYSVALAGIYLSFRSFRELPRAPLRQTVIGVVATAVVIGVAVFALLSNGAYIGGLRARWTQNRIAKKLGDLQTLNERLAYLVAEGDLPSLAVGVVVNDSLVWAKAYGEQDDIDTIYDIGSITKPVVATAVLQLCERGLADLDDDVSDILGFPVVHPEYQDVPITIRLLLSHQSGLSHYTEQYFSYVKSDELLRWEMKHRGRSIYGDIAQLDGRPPYGEFLQGYLTPGGPYYAPGVWSSAEPGTSYPYSTSAYDMLGYVVERVTGQTLLEYLDDNIFGPLNMTSTGLSVADASDQQAIPYDRVYGLLSKTNVELPLCDRRRIGGGGLRSTVPDLAQFLIAHMNQGQVDGMQLIEAETVALMHAKAVEASADIGMAGSGYGWTLKRTEPWEYYGHFYDMRGAQGHGGSDYGYVCSMYMVEEDEGAYGAIVMTNLSELFKSDYTWHFGIYMKIEDLVMQEASARFAQSLRH